MKKTLFVTIITICSSFYTPCKAQYTVLLNFDSANGKYPNGKLLLSGNKLFGAAALGGAYDSGCIFSIDTNGLGYKDLFDFDASTGEAGSNSLTLLGNKLYGVGGKNYGHIFSIDTNGSGYVDLFDFNGTNGTAPQGSLIFYGSKLYGMTAYGGANNHGDVFSIDTNGVGFKDILDFNGTNGATPYGSLTLYVNKLYGMTFSGGLNGSGCIFSTDTNGGGYRKLWDFANTDSNGTFIYGSLIASGKVLYGMTSDGGLYFGGIVFSIDTDGNRFKDLLNFNGYNGSQPDGSLILFGNTLYGTTNVGGTGIDSDGVIFSIDTNGTKYKNMYNFNGIDGANPLFGSVLTLSGKTLYGATYQGGANNNGVIFKIDTDAVAGIDNTPGNKRTINVYPNPSKGLFNFKLRNEELGINSVEVYNMFGEKVYSQLLTFNSPFSIDLSSQPNGIYLYRVIANSGEVIGKGKLIISK
jgi:uncharacterized repeat protein (TIGR03803 family)